MTEGRGMGVYFVSVHNDVRWNVPGSRGGRLPVPRRKELHTRWSSPHWMGSGFGGDGSEKSLLSEEQFNFCRD